MEHAADPEGSPLFTNEERGTNVAPETNVKFTDEKQTSAVDSDIELDGSPLDGSGNDAERTSRFTSTASDDEDPSVTVENDEVLKDKGKGESEDDFRDDDDDSIIDIVSESEVYEAAKQLLNTKAPQIRVHFKGDTYLLLSEYDGDNANEWNEDRIICNDPTDLHRGCNVAFSRIRLFFQKVFGGVELLSRELTFAFPDLDMVMEEDNMYNKDITLNDVVSIFKILKDNSIKNCEPNVSSYLTIDVSTRPRFVSRYNALVEMLSDDATFSNIKIFSNDSNHPVVLDDGEQQGGVATSREVIIMTSDEENTDEEKKEDQVNKHEQHSTSYAVGDRPVESRQDVMTNLPSESPSHPSEKWALEDSLKRKRDISSRSSFDLESM